MAAASWVDGDELVYVLVCRSEVLAAVDLEIADLLPGPGGLHFVALPERQGVIIAACIYDGYSRDAVHRWSGWCRGKDVVVAVAGSAGICGDEAIVIGGVRCEPPD